jgi:hypothetical protein
MARGHWSSIFTSSGSVDSVIISTRRVDDNPGVPVARSRARGHSWPNSANAERSSALTERGARTRNWRPSTISDRSTRALHWGGSTASSASRSGGDREGPRGGGRALEKRRTTTDFRKVFGAAAVVYCINGGCEGSGGGRALLQGGGGLREFGGNVQLRLVFV